MVGLGFSNSKCILWVSYRISNGKGGGLNLEAILISQILHRLPLIVRVEVGITTSHITLGIPLHLCVSVHLAIGTKTRGKSILERPGRQVVVTV